MTIIILSIGNRKSVEHWEVLIEDSNKEVYRDSANSKRGAETLAVRWLVKEPHER